MPANEAVNLNCQSKDINGSWWDKLGRRFGGDPGYPGPGIYMKANDLTLLKWVGTCDKYGKEW